MQGKRLKEAYEGIDREMLYGLDQALDLIKTRKKTKFDETVDIAINLNLDTKKAEQNLRGAISLPGGTGKNVTVAVFAKGQQAEEARKAGADIVGAEDLLEKVQKGFLDFDRCIATPDMMALVGKIGKILGPKGLMPNPKVGTVTVDVGNAVKAIKSGQIEYRTEKNGIVHAGIGKVSFSKEILKDNVLAFFQCIEKAKPSGVKGTYIKRVSLSSTMGIGLKVDIGSLKKE